ncbi:uncharacterized protein AB675_11267 [Cyphellophora attinorum]|uniref:Uncharacterized protein n=1 Tax=Cyphellophora attinorum TaxID=1664694 RepID=A0A0N1H9D7_9EURO|nr:uncharacterized protein AB675_11267 [Phialophora attinorum]KPI40163.1 hypothetical protein AB675_11267 [Phialophora attinorum]
MSIETLSEEQLRTLRDDQERVSLYLIFDHVARIPSRFPNTYGVAKQEYTSRRETTSLVITDNFPASAARAFSRIAAEKIAPKKIVAKTQPKGSLTKPIKAGSVAFKGAKQDLEPLKDVFKWLLTCCEGDMTLPKLHPDPILSMLKLLKIAELIQATRLDTVLANGLKSTLPVMPQTVDFATTVRLLEYPQGHVYRDIVIDRLAEAIVWPNAADALDITDPLMVKLRAKDTDFSSALETAVREKKLSMAAEAEAAKQAAEEAQRLKVAIRNTCRQMPGNGRDGRCNKEQHREAMAVAAVETEEEKRRKEEAQRQHDRELAKKRFRKPKRGKRQDSADKQGRNRGEGGQDLIQI